MTSSQAGLGTIAMVGILVGLGIVFLTVFLFANAGTKKPTDTQSNATNNAAPTSNEPPFIRLPENSLIYTNDKYKFSFAYPSSFVKMTLDQTTRIEEPGQSIERTMSPVAQNKPIGNTGAVMNGFLGSYVYKKDDFKVVIRPPDVFVSPTKTGSGISWKVVSAGASTTDLKIGDSYPIKSTKSQTGVTVFNFSLGGATTKTTNYVFEAGDYYVLVSMPTLSMPSGAALTARDQMAYDVIGTNLASTVRVQPTGNSSTANNATSNSTTTTNN